MKRTAFFVLAAWMASGCSTATPPPHVYTILPSSTQHTQRSAPFSPESLRIAATKTLPSLSSKNLYYLRESTETGPYLYSRWSDTPASMIERSLASSLEESRVFALLLTSTSSAQAAYVLESDLNAFYHRFHADGKSDGYIDITYRLVDGQNKAPLAAKRFQISRPSPTDDAKGGVAALSEATLELSRQCSEWLETLALNRK